MEVSLSVDNELRDAEQLDVKAGGQSSVQFNMDEFDEGELKLTIDRRDDLAIDNTAFVAANLPRRAKVLLVTPGNDPLKMAMSTTEVEKYAEVRAMAPSGLDQEDYQQQSSAGAFDLIGGFEAQRRFDPIAEPAHVELGHRRALPGVDIFRAQDGVELIVDLNDVAFAQ